MCTFAEIATTQPDTQFSRFAYIQLVRSGRVAMSLVQNLKCTYDGESFLNAMLKGVLGVSNLCINKADFATINSVENRNGRRHPSILPVSANCCVPRT